MTNLEKVLEVDGDRFIREIAEKICFLPHIHKVQCVMPPLCGDCVFGERLGNKCKCHTEDIIEWLKAESDDKEE